MANTKHLKMNKITLSFFLFHLSSFFFIASSSTISLGSSISPPSQSWTSDNLTFSLSFIPSPSFPNSFIPAITYAGGLPIWSPGDCRATVDSAGSLRLLPNGALHLINGSGAIVWDSRTANRGVSSASMEDTGELRLLGNGSSVIWSSFDSPTDTIVPGQNFTSDKVLNFGFYSFSLQRTGNLTLRWNDSIVYWNQGLNSSVDANLTSPSLGLQPIGILNLFDPGLSNGVIMAYSSDYA